MLFHRNKIYTYVPIPCSLNELDAPWQFPFYIVGRIRGNNNNWYLFAISCFFLLSVLTVLHWLAFCLKSFIIYRHFFFVFTVRQKIFPPLLVLEPSALCKLFCWVIWSGVTGAADSNGCLVYFLKTWSIPNSHCCQQWATTPHQASSNSKKVTKRHCYL
jgi:hypothetical protein